MGASKAKADSEADTQVNVFNDDDRARNDIRDGEKKSKGVICHPRRHDEDGSMFAINNPRMKNPRETHLSFIKESIMST